MSSRAVTTAVVAVLAGALAAPVATAAVSPREPFTAMTTEGATGSYLLGSGSKSYTGDEVVVTSGSDALSFAAALPAFWQADVEGPTDSDLEVGTYPTARFAGAGVVGLNVFGDGRGCNQYSGTMVVHEVLRDGSGTITSFAASYSTSCETTMPANVGELRYQATTDYERFGVTPYGVPGASRTVTVTTAEETTFGTAAVDGPGAEWFAIDADTCSAAALGEAQSCTLSVRVVAQGTAGQYARLVLPSSSGDRVVSLTAVGVETATGAYTSLAGNRLLDTRKKVGVSTTTPIPPRSYVDVQVTGRGGVPSSGVQAAVLNVTAIYPTTRGYLTVYPAGQPRPTASSVNFNAGWVGANLVTVPIQGAGKVRFYNASGYTHVAADVVGYYHASTSTADPAGDDVAGFESIEPTRVVDTRTAEWGSEPLPGRNYLWQALDWGDAFNGRVVAVAVNVTVTKPSGQGHLIAFDGASATSIPGTSTLNFTAGRTVPNMAIIKVDHCIADCGDPAVGIPRFGIYNASLKPAHVVVDVVGVYFHGEPGDHGWRYQSLTTPTRFVDSRIGLGLSGSLGYNTSRPVTVPSTIAGPVTMAVVTNTTAAQPTKTTVLTLWRNDGSPKPNVSNLNPYAGQVVSNMTMTEVWDLNDFRVHNLAGTTPVVIDAAGTMEEYPAPAWSVAAPDSAAATALRSTGGSNADEQAGVAPDRGQVSTPFSGVDPPPATHSAAPETSTGEGATPPARHPA